MPAETSVVSGDQSMEELRRELAEAREQQAATAEILRVVSRSPMELQRVFVDIARAAARLCDYVAIYQVDGDVLRRVARQRPNGPVGRLTLPLTRGVAAGRAVLERRTVHVADMQTETEEYPESSAFARQSGFRTILAVPLIHAGVVIGVINNHRSEARPFTDNQIVLLETFADQAVIAIENTRLFEAEQASKRELQESLEYQTAISNVLGIISRSPAQLQPVFNAIVVSCKRLLRAHSVLVCRVVGQQLSIAAFTPVSPESDKVLQESYPVPLDGTTVHGATIRDLRPTMICDTETHRLDQEWERLISQRRGFRSQLIVPMLNKGEAIGTISVSRSNPGPFADTEIELLKNFADQAVIAIENTRLFEAEQASKRELQESLERQTATSEVLGVISTSPGELEPVFDTIVMSCKRLFSSHTAVVTRVSEGKVQLAAFTPVSAEADQELKRYYPIELDGKSAVPSAAREGVPFMITDTEMDAHIPNVELARRRGYRSVLVVPMLSQGATIGTINVSRADPGQFSKPEFELLKTFADQAVIAIENARLFEEVQTRTKELQDSLDRQTATSEVLSVISHSQADLHRVFSAILDCALRFCRADLGSFNTVEDGQIIPVEFIPARQRFGGWYARTTRGPWMPQALMVEPSWRHG